MKKVVWAWVWLQLAKGMWREWHMTPLERADRLIRNVYTAPILKMLNEQHSFLLRENDV